jgi:hypothetical protein
LATGNALAITISILSGHEGMQGAGIFSGAAVRLSGGVIGAFLIATVFGVMRRGLGREFAALTKPLRRRQGLRALLIASVIGSVLGLIPYHLALRELSAGVAALVFSTTPLFTLPFARLGVAEARRTTPSLIVGTLLGFVGVGIVLWAQACGGAVAPAASPEAIEVHAPVRGPIARFPRLGQAGRILATRYVGDDEHGLVSSRLEMTEEGLIFAPEEVIVEGGGWFVNWADTPAISPDGGLVTWLQKADSGTYDYHVQYALRQEDGSFAEQGPIHEHTGPGEHGFASLTALDQERVLAVWLDGRLMKEKGPMTLMSRVIAKDGTRGPESVLDGQTCECCPTALITLGDGTALAAWRDRSDEGLRDILLARWTAEAGWGEPFSVHADQWKFLACPVNGPSLVSHGDQVALLWYTEGSNEVSRVNVCLSQDKGVTFSPVQVVDQGSPLGQVSASFDAKGRLLVSWLQRNDAGAAWVVRRVGESQGPIMSVAQVEGKRSDGRARLTAIGEGWALVWTDAVGARLMAAAIQ